MYSSSASRAPAAATPPASVLTVLDGLSVENRGCHRRLTGTVARVVAMLAVRGGQWVRRQEVAGTIWPDSHEARALSNLRTVLWRAEEIRDDLIDSDQHGLRLRSEVAVDLDDLEAAVLRGATCGRVPVLLPDLDDVWVLPERERVRQRVLQILEAHAVHLTAIGRYGDAIDHGLLAIAASPLRESAYATVIDAMLAQSNYGEAVQVYERCAHKLDREMGIAPSPMLFDRFEQAAARRTAAAPARAAS